MGSGAVFRGVPQYWQNFDVSGLEPPQFVHMICLSSIVMSPLSICIGFMLRAGVGRMFAFKTKVFRI